MLLKLEGSVTLDLNAGTDYGVPYDEWVPNVAARQVGVLGRGPYAHVLEDIPLHVRGATGADALTNLAALTEVLDAVGPWSSGEKVDPVLLHYLPTNTSLGTAVKAAVVVAEDEAMLHLSPRVNDAANF